MYAVCDARKIKREGDGLYITVPPVSLPVSLASSDSHDTKRVLGNSVLSQVPPLLYNFSRPICRLRDAGDARERNNAEPKLLVLRSVLAPSLLSGLILWPKCGRNGAILRLWLEVIVLITKEPLVLDADAQSIVNQGG